MKTYIALFRGINVGGNNILPMKDLATLLKGLGGQNVKTYIQSGNAVFQHQAGDAAGLAARISGAIKASYGFDPQVLLLDSAGMEQALAANPFPQAEADPKTLHLYFLAAAPQNPDLSTLNSLRQDNEQFRLIDTVFYLYAPNGIGRSRLAARAEKALGVAATARNWRTVCKIMVLAQQVENPD